MYGHARAHTGRVRRHCQLPRIVFWMDSGVSMVWPRYVKVLGKSNRFRWLIFHVQQLVQISCGGTAKEGMCVFEHNKRGGRLATRMDNDYLGVMHVTTQHQGPKWTPSLATAAHLACRALRQGQEQHRGRHHDSP